MKIESWVSEKKELFINENDAYALNISKGTWTLKPLSPEEVATEIEAEEKGISYIRKD